MRLNHDCIRDIMLYIEDNTSPSLDCVEFDDLCKFLTNQYDREIIHYHIDKLSQAEFISTFYADNCPQYISSLSWIGHEYLDNIRDKTAWEKLKESGLASMSLDVAKDLIKDIVISLAKNKIGLN